MSEYSTPYQTVIAYLDSKEFKYTESKHHADPTIGTCWDADRLDLARVGIYPDPEYMNTLMGRHLANRTLGRRSACEG